MTTIKRGPGSVPCIVRKGFRALTPAHNSDSGSNNNITRSSHSYSNSSSNSSNGDSNRYRNGRRDSKS